MNKVKALIIYIGLLVPTAILVVASSEVFSHKTHDFLMVILSVVLTILVIDIRDGVKNDAR